MRRALLITSAALAWASVAHTAAAATGPVTPFCTTQKALVDQYVGPMVRPPSANSAATTDPKTVGAVVVTLKLGDAPCTFAFGETAIGSGIAPDGQTIFELASVTKTFTTAILALRAAAGLVNVHLPVTLLLPSEYELSPRMQRVSLQQLATFSGGFPWSDPAGFTRSWPQRRFVQEVNALEPTDPIPGEADLPTVNYYSNGSIGFLGQILMNVDRMVGLGDYQPRQRGFTVWMEDNLTGPLAMPSTKVNPQGAWATGYAIANGQYHATLPFLWVPWGAAGALRSNAADMTNFLRANICAHHATDPACAGLPPDLLAALPLAHAPTKHLAYCYFLRLKVLSNGIVDGVVSFLETQNVKVLSRAFISNGDGEYLGLITDVVKESRLNHLLNTLKRVDGVLEDPAFIRLDKDNYRDIVELEQRAYFGSSLER